MCVHQSPNKVRTAPCSQQHSSIAGFAVSAGEGVFVCQLVHVCVCVGGDPTLPLTICSFNWEKKNRDKRRCVCVCVCVKECVCVCRVQTLPPPAGFVMAGFPLFLFQSIMVLRESLRIRLSPSSSCSCSCSCFTSIIWYQSQANFLLLKFGAFPLQKKK